MDKFENEIESNDWQVWVKNWAGKGESDQFRKGEYNQNRKGEQYEKANGNDGSCISGVTTCDMHL